MPVSLNDLNSSEDFNAKINPRIIGWYLEKEIRALKKLKQKLDQHMTLIVNAKSVIHIIQLDALKKDIKKLIKTRLANYNKTFGDDEPLIYQETLNYFQKQLEALDKHGAIDEEVITLAYIDYKHQRSLKGHDMGEPVFNKTLSTIEGLDVASPPTTLKSASSEIIKESKLSPQAASFIPPAVLKKDRFTGSGTAFSLYCKKPPENNDPKCSTSASVEESRLFTSWKKNSNG